MPLCSVIRKPVPREIPVKLAAKEWNVDTRGNQFTVRRRISGYKDGSNDVPYPNFWTFGRRQRETSRAIENVLESERNIVRATALLESRRILEEEFSRDIVPAPHHFGK